MSVKYRNQNGQETIIAGLTPGGNLEAGAVATRKVTSSIPATVANGTGYIDIVFDEPMPDDDFLIEINPGDARYNFRTSYLTANGFRLNYYNTSSSAISTAEAVNITVTKTYTVQHAQENAEDIATLKAVVPASASSTNQLTTKSYVDNADNALDSRLDDIEDVIPTGASISNQLATKSEVAAKQDTLTFDTTPTENSNNPVTSGGIYNAIDTINDALTTLNNNKVEIKTINTAADYPDSTDFASLNQGIYYITTVGCGIPTNNKPPITIPGTLIVTHSTATQWKHFTYITFDKKCIFVGRWNATSTSGVLYWDVIGSTPNPNILDNPWFTVNQREFTSDTIKTSIFPADRWRGSVEDGNITITNSSNGIAISGTPASAGENIMRQVIEWDRFSNKIGQPFTISVLFSDGTIETATDTLKTPTSGWLAHISLHLQNQKLWFQFLTYGATPTWGEFYVKTINTTDAISATIRAIKLEYGSASTLIMDMKPNYQEELLKCQRYCKRISGNEMLAVLNSAGSTIRFSSLYTAGIRNATGRSAYFTNPNSQLTVRGKGTQIALDLSTDVASIGFENPNGSNAIAINLTTDGQTKMADFKSEVISLWKYNDLSDIIVSADP